MSETTLTESEREALIEAVQNGDEAEFVEAILAARLAEAEGALARVRALADWHGVTTCGCGHAAFCHHDEGCIGGLTLCRCRKSLITIFRERLAAALVSPAEPGEGDQA